MSFQDDLTAHATLAQIPLMKNPFLAYPSAITLPYSFRRSTSLASSVSFSIPDIPTSPQYSHEWRAKMTDAKQQSQRWQDEVMAERIRKARKLAPGFLDSDVRMLTPTKRQSMDVDKPVKTDDDYSNQFASLRF